MHQQTKSQKGQSAVLLALMMVGLLAFVALAIDGGNSYLVRRNAQNAADAAAMAGSRELYRYLFATEQAQFILDGGDPEDWLQIVMNDVAQRNGVPDSDDNLDNIINDHLQAWYLDSQFRHLREFGGSGIPFGARGIAVRITIPFDTFLAGIIGRAEMAATVDAAAQFTEQGPTVTNAIYANGNCEPKTLEIGGAGQYLVGGIHSNANLSISGNTADPSYISGTVSYAGSVSYNPSQVVIDSPPDDVPVSVRPRYLPLLFDIEDYAPGGAKAKIAMEAGEYFTYTKSGADLLPVSGLHYGTDGFTLGPQLTGTPLNVTIVTPGKVTVKAGSLLMPYMDGLLIFSTYGSQSCPSNQTAVSFSNDEFNWMGLIYAPNGHIEMQAALNSTFYGSIVGWSIKLAGSWKEIRYDMDYDPPRPPDLTLIW